MEELIKQIDLYKDDPLELSKIGLELSAQLYYHNTKMADAELREKETMLNYLKEGSPLGQKRSVAESELYGIIETFNDYGKLKAQGEAVIEIMNMIKTRIKVLTGEKEMSR